MACTYEHIKNWHSKKPSGWKRTRDLFRKKICSVSNKPITWQYNTVTYYLLIWCWFSDVNACKLRLSYKKIISDRERHGPSLIFFLLHIFVCCSAREWTSIAVINIDDAQTRFRKHPDTPGRFSFSPPPPAIQSIWYVVVVAVRLNGSEREVHLSMWQSLGWERRERSQGQQSAICQMMLPCYSAGVCKGQR